MNINNDKIITNYSKYFLIFSFILISCLTINIFEYTYLGFSYGYVASQQKLTNIIYSIIMIIYFIGMRKNYKKYNFLNYIGDNSYFIYYIHYIFVIVIKDIFKILSLDIQMNYYLFIILSFICTLFPSILLSQSLNIIIKSNKIKSFLALK